MTDAFLDDEQGIETSNPREFYEIVQSPLVTYRITSGVRDITYNGLTYTATPMARTDIEVVTAGGGLGLTLTLPLYHGLAQRWLAQAVPPRQVNVTVYRQQSGGEVEVVLIGQVLSMAMDGHIAKFLLESWLTRQLDRQVLSLVTSRLCQHRLFDANCKVVEASFTVATTVVAINGRRVTVVGSNPAFGDQNYAVGGALLHVSTQERMLILTENGVDSSGNVVIEMQTSLPDLKVGDSVTIFAGCAHTTAVCHDKFSNMVNYGGWPEIPAVDLFIPGNKLGIYGS